MEQQLREWLFNQASYYIDYLQPEKSIILLEAVCIAEPDNLDTHRMLSYAYLQTKQFEKSIQAADTFLKYIKKGRDARAIKWIKARALLGIKNRY